MKPSLVLPEVDGACFSCKPVDSDGIMSLTSLTEEFLAARIIYVSSAPKPAFAAYRSEVTPALLRLRHGESKKRLLKPLDGVASQRPVPYRLVVEHRLSLAVVICISEDPPHWPVDVASILVAG